MRSQVQCCGKRCCVGAMLTSPQCLSAVNGPAYNVHRIQICILGRERLLALLSGLYALTWGYSNPRKSLSLTELTKQSQPENSCWKLLCTVNPYFLVRIHEAEYGFNMEKSLFWRSMTKFSRSIHKLQRKGFLSLNQVYSQTCPTQPLLNGNKRSLETAFIMDSNIIKRSL